MLAGIDAVLKKEYFDFKNRDPTGYVKAVARSRWNEQGQKRVEQAHMAEKQALKNANSDYMKQIEEAVKQ